MTSLLRATCLLKINKSLFLAYSGQLLNSITRVKLRMSSHQVIQKDKFKTYNKRIEAIMKVQDSTTYTLHLKINSIIKWRASVPKIEATYKILMSKQMSNLSLKDNQDLTWDSKLLGTNQSYTIFPKRELGNSSNLTASLPSILRTLECSTKIFLQQDHLIFQFINPLLLRLGHQSKTDQFLLKFWRSRLTSLIRNTLSLNLTREVYLKENLIILTLWRLRSRIITFNPPIK